jgi:hypothetical protein
MFFAQLYNPVAKGKAGVIRLIVCWCCHGWLLIASVI